MEWESKQTKKNSITAKYSGGWETYKKELADTARKNLNEIEHWEQPAYSRA